MPRLKPPAEGELAAAMYDIADALRSPVDHRGRRYDVKFLVPILSFHLARAGFRKVEGKAVIKPRRVPPPPEYENTKWGEGWDAIEWVPIDAEPSIEDELATATLADLDRLSPAARDEVLRRLGAKRDAPQPAYDNVPWRVEPSIHFDDPEDEQ